LPNPVALPISEPHAPSLHKRYPVLAGRTVALMLSRIDAKKGHDLLIRAFARAHARRPELALLVAGSGDTALLARLQGLADELGVGRAIVWAGFLEGEAKLAALGEADLFVLPSLSENFANAVVEAMAAACPVIVSEQVGIQDAVAEAGAGLVVPTDEAALAQALVRLVDDPEGRRIMGAKGQAYARAHFAPEVVARQLVQIYLGLLARARRSQQAAQPTKR
jgi:glycosyltransferase involved in cell wall biosynthesis